MEEGQQLTKEEEVELRELIERKETDAVLQRWPCLSPQSVIQAVGTSVLEQVHIPTNIPQVTLTWLQQIAENIAPDEEEEAQTAKRPRDDDLELEVEEEEEQEIEEEEEQQVVPKTKKRPKKSPVDLSELFEMCRIKEEEEADVLTPELEEARTRYMLDMSPCRKDFLMLLALGWFVHVFQDSRPNEINLWRDVASHVHIGSSKPSSDKRLRQALTLYELIAVHGMHRLRHLQPKKGTVATLCAQKAEIIQQLQDQQNEWTEQGGLDFSNIQWIPQ